MKYKNDINFFVVFALILMLLGGSISFGTFAISGFDISILGWQQNNIVTNEYNIEGDIRSIELEDMFSDIKLQESEDETLKIKCVESDEFSYDIRNDNGRLSVKLKDRRNWLFKIGVQIDFNQDRKLIVSLPKQKYKNLDISNVSGNVEIKDFEFEDVNLKLASGDLKLSGKFEDMKIESVSGSIDISNTQANDVAINSKSSDIKLLKFKPSSIQIKNVSGYIQLDEVIVTNGIIIDGVSTDIMFEDSDADKIDINTISGDISGELLSPKQFNVRSLSGNINVPNDNSAKSLFRGSTTSGNIEITVK